MKCLLITVCLLVFAQFVHGLTLLSPKKGDAIEAGTSLRIEWKSEAQHVGKQPELAIFLLSPAYLLATPVVLVKEQRPVVNDLQGSYTWTIPKDMEPGAYVLTVSESLPGDLPGSGGINVLIHITAPNEPDRVELVADYRFTQYIEAQDPFQEVLKVTVIPRISTPGEMHGLAMLLICTDPLLRDALRFKLFRQNDTGEDIEVPSRFFDGKDGRLAGLAFRTPVAPNARIVFEFHFRVDANITGRVHLGLAQESLPISALRGTVDSEASKLPSVIVGGREIPVYSTVPISQVKLNVVDAVFRFDVKIPTLTGARYVVETTSDWVHWQPLLDFIARAEMLEFPWITPKNQFGFLRAYQIPASATSVAESTGDPYRVRTMRVRKR